MVLPLPWEQQWLPGVCKEGGREPGQATATWVLERVMKPLGPDLRLGRRTKQRK